MAKRACIASTSEGKSCLAPPLHDDEYCLAHSPEHSEEMAAARRSGGFRRRRERAVSDSYDFQGVESIPKVRRLLEIAVADTLVLENSVARSRTLAYLVVTALKMIELGEHEERLQALETAIRPRLSDGRGNGFPLDFE